MYDVYVLIVYNVYVLNQEISLKITKLPKSKQHWKWSLIFMIKISLKNGERLTFFEWN